MFKHLKNTVTGDRTRMAHYFDKYIMLHNINK